MPTFPTTVSANGFGGTAPGNTLFRVSSTTRYTVDYNSVDGTFEMQKSSDNGQTWVVVDVLTVPGVNFDRRFAGAITGDLASIYFVYMDGTNNLSCAVFDVGADTWGAPVQGPSKLSDLNLLSLCCAYQNSANTLNVVIQTGSTGDSQNLTQYIRFSGGVWGVYEPSTVNDIADLSLCMAIAIVQAGDFTQVIFQVEIVDVGLGFYQQSYNAGVQSTPEFLLSSDTFGEINPQFPFTLAYDSIGDIVWCAYSWAGVPIDRTSISAASLPNGDVLPFSFTPLSVGTANQFVNGLSLSIFGDASVFYQLEDSITGDCSWEYRVDSGSGFGDATVIGAELASPGFSAYLTLQSFLGSGGFGISFSGTVYYWELPVTPPIVAALTQKPSQGGGTYFPRFRNKTLLNIQLSHQGAGGYGSGGAPPLSSFYAFPNVFDLCLTKDWTLYNQIDREVLGCGIKPACFLTDERSWVDQPKGGVTFNPAGVLPLPAPIDGDVVVSSFRVPLGFDGIVLGQYHTYTDSFTDGSGDLVWRVRVDGRYLKDCGEMLVIMGNPQTLSPVYGGLQLRSNNLVEYLVSAPNGGGSLPPPGTGNVLAGLHGWLYPRL